ncbi:MAG: AMP-binding protein [Candidatus Marinimicrobia bacterium]|nr:AMP-binding protein [Candidatus Neomarinimicrobiota bacterium]
MSFRASCLHSQAVAHPSQPALVVGTQALTFDQLARRVDGLAARFVEARWPGAAVGVWLPDDLPLVEAIWAVPRAGAILVPLHARLPGPELAAYLAEVHCTRLYTTQALYAGVQQALSDSLEVMFVEAAPPSSGSLDPGEAVPEEALHSILLTSGTTGQPKAVRLTYGNHRSSAASWCRFLQITSSDHYLCPLPLSHVGGLGILFRGALVGFKVTCLPKFSAAAVNQALDGGAVTHVSLVPTQLHRMIKLRGGRHFSRELKALVLGGGPASPELIDQALELGAPLVKTYGMTETASGVTAFRVWEHPGKRASAGQPLGSATLSILNADGSPVPLREVGNIAVQGPSVMAGYLDGPATGGQLVTRDRGWLDEDGFLYVTPGPLALIISGGENVDPLEVEQVLLGIPHVQEACVVGIPDADLGQRVVAVVVAEPGQPLDELALVRACRQKLAAFKVPKSIIVWPALPKTPVGKVQRRKVLDRLLREA